MITALLIAVMLLCTLALMHASYVYEADPRKKKKEDYLEHYESLVLPEQPAPLDEIAYYEEPAAASARSAR